MSETIHNWQDLNLQGGELVLCAGRSRLSRIIQKVQKYAGAPNEHAKFTHVAKTLQVVENGLLSIYESTTLNKYNNKKGVQADYIGNWLPNYNGEVYIRKLHYPRTEDFFTIDYLYYMEHLYDSYESGIPGHIELLLCAIRLNKYIPWYTPMETKELHCTEMIAKNFDGHNLWKYEIRANRMPPWMWYSEIDGMLKCDISEPIRIK